LQKPLKEIENKTSSTTVKHLSHSDVENVELPLPAYDDQVQIRSVLSDMDSDIIVLESKLDKYRMIKEGMMQKLLTGKIRLV
jgi:type I restriction enzyme S subunit